MSSSDGSSIWDLEYTNEDGLLQAEKIECVSPEQDSVAPYEDIPDSESSTDLFAWSLKQTAKKFQPLINKSMDFRPVFGLQTHPYR